MLPSLCNNGCQMLYRSASAAYLDVLILFNVLAFYTQRTRLGVKVYFQNLNTQRDSHLLAVNRARGAFALDLPVSFTVKEMHELTRHVLVHTAEWLL
jgi:hypothetical protein